MNKTNKSEPEKPEKPKNKLKNHKKKWIILAVSIVLVISLVLALTVDYNLITVGIKLAIKPGKMSTPDNYSEILQNTQVLAKDLSYESQHKNGFLDIYAPAEVKGSYPLLVYIHGGYYVGGDKKSAEPYCRIIANEGYVVANINYMLAPSAKYPTQAKQANEAIDFLCKNADTYNIDKDQIFIGGDSAGGHLSSQLGAFYTNSQLQEKMNIVPSISPQQLKGVLLLCGFYDAYTVRDSKFPFLNTAMWSWTDVRNYESYSRWEEINTIQWVTEYYPATFLTCGYDDPLYIQAQQMEEKLENNNVDVVSYLPQNSKYKLKHEFQRDFSLKEAKVAMDNTIAFMNSNSYYDGDSQRTYANFTFSGGEKVKVLLMPKYAPISVENFIKYAEAGFYNNIKIHRIIPNKVVQTGGYTIDNEKKAALFAPIVGEFGNNGYAYNKLSHQAGVISMARTSVMDSATSEFFFCVTDCSYYDKEYAAFGKIVEGLAFVDEIASSSVSVDVPRELFVITSVTITVE